MEENYIELTDDEFAAYLDVALAEAFTKPGTANVSAKDKAKLKGLLAHYMKMAHPFTACKRDQLKHGLSEDHANRRCAVLKDVGTGTTKWRGKDTKKAASDTDAGEPVVLTLDVPEGWQEEFVRELADVVAVETQPEPVALTDAGAYLSQFQQAQRSATSAIGADYKEPDFSSPEQAAGWFSQLSEWIRSTLRVSKANGEYYLAEVPSGEERSVGTQQLSSGPVTDSHEAHHGYLTPLVSLSSTSIELAKDGKTKQFWKQILPLGKAIKYRDGMLRTDKEFLAKLADNINSGRFPAPFVAVNSKNQHDESPEQARGMVKAARVTKAGLDVQLEPRTPEAEKFLTDFPEVPVSAFYDEDYTDVGTGEHVGPRLFHVAATWRPYVNGMSPMELIAASDQGADVIDLTGAEYTDPGAGRKEAQVADDNTGQQQGGGVELTDEQQQQDTQVAAAEAGGGNTITLTADQWAEHERRLAAAEAKAEAEQFARLSERTLTYLRGKYPQASEAQVRAAHTLLTQPREDGGYAVQLSSTGEVSLADKEQDARGDLITTLLEGCNSAPELSERGADGDGEDRPGYEAAQAEARQLAEQEGIEFKDALRRVMNQRATRGEVTL